MRLLHMLVAATGGLSLLTSCGEAVAVDVGLGLPEMKRPDGWTPQRASLGAKLFFDTRLSSNGEMSCSTCHLHEHGWTDGKQFSQKVDGSMNTRNSPSLYNVGYQPHFYWDGRAPSMEANVGAAWKGHMVGSDDQMKAVVAAIAGVEGYAKEFQDVFAAPPSRENVVDALCAFVHTLQAGGTRYDAFAGGDKTAMTQEEQAGKDLFFAKAGCIACHVPPLFTDFQFHNMGIGMDAEQPDAGRQARDPKAALGSFKTPSLRGVSKTAPYFHDGSVETLEEAVRIMAGGGIENPHLDPILKGLKGRPALSDTEIRQLVAFLKALEPTETFEKPELP